MASHPLFPLLLDIRHTIGVLERVLAAYREPELADLLAEAINARPPPLFYDLYRLETMIRRLREGMEQARREGRYVE